MRPTFCLALRLAAINRRQQLEQRGAEGRKVLDRYTVALVDRYAEMAAAGAFIFYSFFAMSAKPQRAVSITFDLFGLFATGSWSSRWMAGSPRPRPSS